MSKSRGNVVSPDDVIAKLRDRFAMRLYEMFMGPLDKGAPWSDESIPGRASAFLQRAYIGSSWRMGTRASQLDPGCAGRRGSPGAGRD